MTTKNLFDIIKAQPIVYDALGNPTTYRGNALAWTKISCLASYGSNTFEYNASGIRFKKNNTIYTLDGNKILKETDGTKTISYYYGVDGVVGFNYNGNDYYYRKNLQGDVIEIYRADGAKVANYIYDAWGKVIECFNANSENIATLNPFRYRSYYYDVETSLYYLQTRYYDPEVGRFISADNTKYLEPKTINGLNLYAYCLNNPILYGDPNGNSMSFLAMVAIGALVGMVSSAIISTMSYVLTAQEISAEELVSSAVRGAVSGFIAGAISTVGVYLGATMAITLGAIGGGIGEFSGSLSEKAINGTLSKDNMPEIMIDTCLGAAGGALGGLVIGPSAASATVAFKNFIKHPVKNFFSDLTDTLMMDFANWLSQVPIKSITAS